MTIFNVGKWQLQIMQDMIAFMSLQTLIEDSDTLESHSAKVIEKSPLQASSALVEMFMTQNPGIILNANSVFARQMVVLLVTYMEAIISDFLTCLFKAHPQRMYDYLAPKGEEYAQKGKVDLKDVIEAASKDDLLQSLAEKATANATKGKFNSTVKILEQTAKTKIDGKTLTALQLLVESRNRIIHEASTETITALQIREGAELLQNFLQFLKPIAESNGIAVEDMFEKLDEVKFTKNV